MKNILAENMLRFGVKNLKESDKKVLSEALLLEQIQAVTTVLDTLNAEMAKNPTILGNTYSIYPKVFIENSAVLPDVGKPMAASTVGTLPAGTGWAEYEYGLADSTYAKKTVPRKLGCSVRFSLISGKTDNTAYKTFINQLPMMSTYRLWGGRDIVGANDTPGSVAPSAAVIKTTLTNYCNKFYYLGPNQTFWDTRNVQATITGATSNYSTQIDTLLNTLKGLNMMIMYVTSMGKPMPTSQQTKFKYVCLND